MMPVRSMIKVERTHEFLVTIHLFCLPDPVLLADLAFRIRKQFRTNAFLVTKLRVFQAILAVDAEQDAIVSALKSSS
jgi:hypothetical protein